MDRHGACNRFRFVTITILIVCLFQVHVSLINGRPSFNYSSEILRNFTLARYVRFKFQKIHKTEKDLILRKKLFYSIKNIIIGGQCLCHGHASKCVPNKITGVNFLFFPPTFSLHPPPRFHPTAFVARE